MNQFVELNLDDQRSFPDRQAEKFLISSRDGCANVCNVHSPSGDLFISLISLENIEEKIHNRKKNQHLTWKQ